MTSYRVILPCVILRRPIWPNGFQPWRLGSGFCEGASWGLSWAVLGSIWG